MFCRIVSPITGRLRLAGSGLFLSVPAGPLVHAMLPHRASPHGAIRTTAVFAATIQSPVGYAASAGLLTPTLATAASQDLRIPFLRIPPIRYVPQTWHLDDRS